MKEQIIIITGKQGSGKSTMARKLVKAYETAKEPIEIIEYTRDIIIPKKSNVIIVVQKEALINALEALGEINYIIIDTDNK